MESSTQMPRAAAAASCSFLLGEASDFLTSSAELAPPAAPSRRSSAKRTSSSVALVRALAILAPSAWRVGDFLRISPAVSSAAWRIETFELYRMISRNFGKSGSVARKRQAWIAAMAAAVLLVVRQNSIRAGTTAGFLRLFNTCWINLTRMSSAIICLVANSTILASTSVLSVALAHHRACKTVSRPVFEPGSAAALRSSANSSLLTGTTFCPTGMSLASSAAAIFTSRL